jgi:hypothetical protein
MLSFRNALETHRCLETLPPAEVGFGGTSLAHELFMNTYVGRRRRRSLCTGIII